MNDRTLARVVRFEVLLAALWWGSLTTLGFMVVPLLFAWLPTPAVAGALAARFFSVQTWVSVACGLALLCTIQYTKKAFAHASIAEAALLFIAGGMLSALLVEFAVAPRILSRTHLPLWHGIGSALYFAQWLCAGLTLWRLAAPGDIEKVEAH